MKKSYQHLTLDVIFQVTTDNHTYSLFFPELEDLVLGKVPRAIFDPTHTLISVFCLEQLIQEQNPEALYIQTFLNSYLQVDLRETISLLVKTSEQRTNKKLLDLFKYYYF